MVGEAQKSHGAEYELNFVFGLEKVARWNPIRTTAIQTRSRPMRFLGFSRSGWSDVRSVSLARGGTSKKRPLPHLHKGPRTLMVHGDGNMKLCSTVTVVGASVIPLPRH
jgi:hypothetical protein